MAQVDSENSIAMPARAAGAIIPSGQARQQRQRERTLQRLARLRKKAADEVERLLAFLDASDPYASTELEAGVDDVPIDETELEREEGNDEPSLGWTDEEAARGRHYAGASRRCMDLEQACEDEGVL